MNWNQIWSTLVGTIAGFVFSLALFYFTDRIKRRHDRMRILRGLQRELKFDLALFDSLSKGIEDARLKVAVGDKDIYLYLDYSRFLSIFIIQAVREGILYDLLTNEDLVGLDKAMRTCNAQPEKEFSDRLTLWKSGQIGNSEMFKTLEFHKFIVSTSKTALETIAAKIDIAK
jgi:hypothetical protein